MESLLELPLMVYSTARSAHFSLQFDVLSGLSRKIPGLLGKRKPAALMPPPAQVRNDLMALLKQDTRNIGRGLYPLSVLKPESPMDHFLRIPQIIADGLSIYSRRRRGRTTEFSASAREQLSELPRYYRRNFHFQTDGYLSEHSASLYEHQVEMLFRGSADAMRRLILPPLKAHFGARSKNGGRGLRILEIGAGTGRSTRFMHLMLPKARIVATDLSAVYLEQARKRLPGNLQVDFLQADGGALPFADQQFDAVYSVFLFHELPLTARKQLLLEARRVLKPGGFFGMVDSIQNGDKPAFDPLLAQFPIDYHEPFFRDYAAKPMEKLVRGSGFTKPETGMGFFSKVVSARKPA
jgi:SAM-dependent methyltransferase